MTADTASDSPGRPPKRRGRPRRSDGSVGLVAGLYFAYAISVMPGLAALDDRAFVDAAQQLDDAIRDMRTPALAGASRSSGGGI